MIQIVLLTGFLGAGKTTLMQSLLKSYANYKVGVIVNEFGEINIDGKLIQKEGVEMTELSNGSIFCACIKDKFVDSLIEMSSKDLDYVFIEASGLADPANFKNILEGIKPYTIGEYLYTGSICVLDGLNFVDMCEVLPALSHQVEYANAVIINKADLIVEEGFKEIFDKLDEINPDVNRYITSYCKVDIKEVIDNFTIVLKESEETTNTYESRPNSFILKSVDVLNYDKLYDFIKDLAPDSFRIKGFADTDKGYIEIQAVVKDIHISQWTGEEMGTEIVVISSIGIKMLSRIVRASNEYLDGKIKL